MESRAHTDAEIEMTNNYGSYKGESALQGILLSHMQRAYCTFLGFLFVSLAGSANYFMLPVIPFCINILHDAVCTNARTTLQHLLVSFSTVQYEEKQPKCLNFQFTSWKDLKFQASVRADIFVTRLHLVINVV